MDFDLSSEQIAFRDLMREFANKSIRPVVHSWESSGRYPTAIVAVSYAIVFEELSKVWMGIAGIIGSHSLATRMIANHGTDEQKAHYLPELASGKRRTGIALTEPGAGSDLQGITTVARRLGNDYVINGTKTWITNARFANPLPVLVKTDPSADPRHRGMSVLLVEAGVPGFTVGRDLGKLGYKGPESCEV